MSEPLFFIVFKVLIGVLVGGTLGSFFGLVTHRLPLGQSIIKPRSYCDSCGRQLEPRDLIPIVSYVLNKGECRFCHASISPRHVMFEAVGMVMCVGLALMLFPSP
jgi:prepilin signal peptidase PulO-like enzyme (type II secretory pathway)